MSDHPPPLPLSEAESRDFEALGIPPGSWAALAPAPLLRFPAIQISAGDYGLLREFAATLPGGLGGADNPEGFWSRSTRLEPPPFAVSLLGWYLAHRVAPMEREAYLTKLREVAVALLPPLLREASSGPVNAIHKAIAAAIGQREYSRELGSGFAEVSGGQPVQDQPNTISVASPTPPQAEPSTVVLPPPRPLCEVTTATGFKSLTFAEALRRASRVTVSAVRHWLTDASNERGLLFDDFRTDCPEVAIVSNPAAVPRSLWIVGDIHADVLSLANLIEFARGEAEKLGEQPAFVFLGDYIDRGCHDHETLLLLFHLVISDPGRVCVIPGNHDVDLRWGEKSQKFGVSIQPAEYCDRLNRLVTSEAPADREQVELARLAIEFWKARPKAVFLPDGTAFAHGGFPHTDTHDTLLTRADLGTKRCLDDFLWARLSESPKKRPNRGNRGHEFGSGDFAQFCGVMANRLGVPVQRLVRGHDHVFRRWQFPAEYVDNPVLTINAMGWRLEGEGEPDHGPHPYPVVARHVPGDLPRIIRVPLDPVEVERALGKRPPEPDQTPWDDFPSGPYVGEPDAAPPPAREPGSGV